MILRLSLLFILFNAFLVSAKLPDGLFTAKEVGLYFIVALTSFFALGVLLFKKQKKGVRLVLLDWLVLGYLCLLPLIQLLIFNDIAISKILIQIAYSFVYISIRIICSSEKLPTLISGLTEIIMLILGCQLIIAIAQYGGIMPSYYPRFGPTGMFFNPGPFAIFVSSLLGFIAVRALNSFLTGQYIVFGAHVSLIILGMFFVFFSLSRSAWIGLSVGLIISLACFISVRYKTWLNINRRILFKLGFGIMFLLLPIGYWLYQIKTGSADGRVLVWLTTIELIRDNGFAGVGIGNFAPTYVHYQANFLNSSSEKLSAFGSIAGDSRYAFNDLLQIFSELGISGFVIFILIVVQTIRLLLKELKTKASQNEKVIAISGIFGTIAVILVAGLTSYPLQMIPIALVFWIFIAVSVSFCEKDLDRTLNSRTSIWTLSFVLTTGIFIFSYYGLSRTQAYLNWMKAEKIEMGTKKLLNMEKYHTILGDHAEFLFSYATLYAKYDDYNNAVKFIKHALKFNPAPVYYYSLGSYYEKLGKYEAASECYQTIRSAIPNLLTPRFLEAKLHLHKADTVTFLIKAKEALNFEPKIYNKKVREMRLELTTLIVKHNKSLD